MTKRLFLTFACLFAAQLCLFSQSPVALDSLMAHVRTLASDAYGGRRTGEAGNNKAGQYIEQRFKAYGLEPIKESYQQPFQFYSRFLKKPFDAVNIWGMVEGTRYPDSFLVLSAHYDHVGTRKGEIYNGADDNASGVGALLELARYFAKAPTEYSLIFISFDAEEIGLKGAQHFTEEPPVPLSAIKCNINMDMVGRNAQSEIYICGTKHYPHLLPLLQPLAASQTGGLTVSFGHDSPEPTPADDWTLASDHGYFHKAGIPFLYFGVEDHEDYHKPTDDAERIMPDFYQQVCELVRQAVLKIQTIH